MSTLNEQIVQVVFGLANFELDIPFINYSLPILNVLYAILINYSYRSALGVTHSQIGWYQGLLATLVMRAGGGCTVSILRGEPIGILKSNATYFFMFSNTYVYQILDVLFNVPMIEHVFTLSDSILRALAMCQSGIDGVTSNPALGPNKYVAKVLCGTLAGCGGGLWIDTFRLTHSNWSFSTPRLLHAASIDMKTSFTSTLFYVAATSPEFCHWLGLPVLEPKVAQAWSAVLMSSGFAYKSYVKRWERRIKDLKEQKEKASEKKSE
ncbi:hypothetical protein G6F24_006397 [Rhizopus arrhizus]|nr:hypothetical protein G6F24_006397 [Rhizopus arrhizus]